MKKLIYDIGMHTGKDTMFYLKKGFKVIAVEGNPKLVNDAKIEFEKYINTGQLVIINKVISNKSTLKVDFYVNKDKDDWGTILPDWNRSMNSNYETIEVESVKLEDIIEEYGMPYYMKIDIEGADILCLKSLLKINKTPEFLSIELLTPCNLKNNNQNCLEILSNLNALGYNSFQISDQSRNHKVVCPKPSLEGEYVDQKFGGDSSGLFGEELKVEKFRFDTLAKMYLSYFYNQEEVASSRLKKMFLKLNFSKKKEKNIFPLEGWFDVHASKNKSVLK